MKRIRLETRDQRRRVYWLAKDGQLTPSISEALVVADDVAEAHYRRVISTWCRSNLDAPTVKIVPA